VIDWECTYQVGKRVIIPAEFANKIFMIIYKQLKIKAMENELNKMTAVEWLVKYLSERGYIQAPSFGHSIIDKAINQAKQMEKEQIKDAYFIGGHDIKNNRYRGMHEYYNETYGGNNGK
jgi:hypothetical protein